MSDATRATTDEPLFGSWARFAMGSVGSKVVMAITGLGLWVFILGHLAGNLTAFAGRDLFNHYAAALHANPALVWAVRLALLVGFPLHIWAALRTARLNGAARPVPYAWQNRAPARLAARTMVQSGLVVLAFFAYHLAHFTWRVTGPMPPLLADGSFDPYGMLVMGFQQPLIALFYVLAQVLLAAHLSHGLYSMFQHLGVNGPRWTPWLKSAAQTVGYFLCAAFASIPLAVLLGIVKP